MLQGAFRDLGDCMSGDARGNVHLILSDDLWDSCDQVAASVASLSRLTAQGEWQSSIRKGARQWTKKPDTR
jgi:hypothetical protein